MSFRSKVSEIVTRFAPTRLNAVVEGNDEVGLKWNEVADLVSYSPTGASFNLYRSCEVGTLVSMIIPLPATMRCYDHDQEFYSVWGLIQHCERMTADDSNAFHIGVAFIGKDCPPSYGDDPLQQYRISGVRADGMWKVDESKTPFKKRTGVRFWQPIHLYLALIDTKDRPRGGERTVTENVSGRGAAVFTTLNVGIGDRVKFITEEYDFSGLAVVCNSEVGGDGRTRVHLSFVENAFPVSKLVKSKRSLQPI